MECASTSDGILSRNIKLEPSTSSCNREVIDDFISNGTVKLEKEEQTNGKYHTRGIKVRYSSDEEINDTSKKRRRVKGAVKKENNKESKVTNPNKRVTVRKVNVNRCEVCRQLLDNPNLLFFPGPPANALEEVVALTDPSLCLFTGQEEAIVEHDQRPILKITQFGVYDQKGHLCHLDGGAIERNQLLFAYGYIKPVYSDNPDADDGVAATEIGPLIEWYISGFDGGEKAVVGFATAVADYYLMAPSESYAPLMNELEEKIYLSKAVIEYLIVDDTVDYEDLLAKLQTTVLPNGSCLTEDALLRHAQFVCDRVYHFDAAGAEDEPQLIVSPCMRTLIQLAGITLGKRRATRRLERGEVKVKKPSWTKATTTPLVRNVFESFFKDQMENQNEKEIQGPRRHRCGICEACQQTDCGKCNFCRDMVKFGGSGRGKQSCVLRKCPNMAVQVADDDDLDEEEQIEQIDIDIDNRPHHKAKRHAYEIQWSEDTCHTVSGNTYYQKAVVNGEKINIGDFVTVEPDQPGVPLYVAQVMAMWEDKTGEKYFHAQWYCRGSDTVLGETCDPQEVFLLDDCEDCLLSAIMSPVTVLFKETEPRAWKLAGGADDAELPVPSDDGKTFWYRLWYDPRHGRFESPPTTLPNDEDPKKCPCCVRLEHIRQREKPKLGKKTEQGYENVLWREMEIKPGDSVFLTPDTFNFTWYRDDLTVEEAEIVSHWTNEHTNLFVNLGIFIVTTFLLTVLASTLPVPSGSLIPIFKMGAAFGRIIGEAMHLWFPEGVRIGSTISPILPGGYAIVGAAAFSAGVTHSISICVVISEMTGQIRHIIPVMIAVLVSNAISTLLQPSLYDSIIMIKKLPYLPDILPSSSGAYNIFVEDFMVRNIKYVWNGMSYKDLKQVLKEGRKVRAFPLVDNPDNMILFGSIQRTELISLLESHIGRDRRLQVAAKWQLEAQTKKREEMARFRLALPSTETKAEDSATNQVVSPTTENQHQPAQRRPSRFEVVRAPDVLNNEPVTPQPQPEPQPQSPLQLDPPPEQLTPVSIQSAETDESYGPDGVSIRFPRKSILKKTNSFIFENSGPMISPVITPYSTVTGAESGSKIRQAIGAIFRRSSTALDPTKLDLGSSPFSIATSPNSIKKVQLPRERVIDMSQEEQKQWEEAEMAKAASLQSCQIDPAPFQLVERTSLLKVHSMFSLLGVNRAYVTTIGRLIGIVSLNELRKAIEDVNAGIIPTTSHSNSSQADSTIVFRHSREASPGAPEDVETGPDQPGLSDSDSDEDDVREITSTSTPQVQSINENATVIRTTSSSSNNIITSNGNSIKLIITSAPISEQQEKKISED